MKTGNGAPSPAEPADWRHDASFRTPERVPWSVLGPQFHVTFGNVDPADPQPEGLEIIGQNGSGKTYAGGKIYQERAFVTGRASILMAHKSVEATLLKLGWPIANTWDQVTAKVRDGHTNLIYWPRTRLMGNARKDFYDKRMTEALDHLWVSATPKQTADTDVIFDDYGFVEDSLPETAGRVKQFLREGRALGFSTGLFKQRAQGGTRYATSETQWTLGFRPADDADLERWAELFGARRDWIPVLRSLDRVKREFVIKHTVTQEAYISWIDKPLAPRQPPRRRRGLREVIGF
jgi:hypothetical protein